jgi:hypothetical protein
MDVGKRPKKDPRAHDAPAAFRTWETRPIIPLRAKPPAREIAFAGGALW